MTMPVYVIVPANDRGQERVPDHRPDYSGD